MTTELKDVLHLYLGQKAIHNGHILQVCGLNVYSDKIQNITNENTRPINEIKLLLRPLESMTEEEVTVYLKMKYNAVESFHDVRKSEAGYGGFWFQFNAGSKQRFIFFLQMQDESNAEQFKYLLSKGFDLFGLIESSHALDISKHTHH